MRIDDKKISASFPLVAEHIEHSAAGPQAKKDMGLRRPMGPICPINIVIDLILTHQSPQSICVPGEDRPSFLKLVPAKAGSWPLET